MLLPPKNHGARVIAGILLGGWLLMLPEMVKRGGELVANTNAPISTWGQGHAYDTARECEESRLRQWSNGDGDKRKREFWEEARCVPVEVVYPTRESAPE